MDKWLYMFLLYRISKICIYFLPDFLLSLKIIVSVYIWFLWRNLRTSLCMSRILCNMFYWHYCNEHMVCVLIEQSFSISYWVCVKDLRKPPRPSLLNVYGTWLTNTGLVHLSHQNLLAVMRQFIQEWGNNKQDSFGHL